MGKGLRVIVIVAVAIAGCEEGGSERPPESLDEVAEAYVRLVLALGQHDPGYVDAYYGPESWKAEAEAMAPPLAEIGSRARLLLGRLGGLEPADAPEIVTLRHRYLEGQLAALEARTRMLGGERWSFDEESEALYGVVAPSRGEAHFRAVLEELDALLDSAGAGDGPVHQRYEAFRRAFVVPAERLEEVFDAAIAACRERTAAHLELPSGESFVVEYVDDKPWSAYNWYQGGYRSLIQVNTDLPVHIDRALDLACHEGYPGHHVYNALLERHLVRERGWVEHTVYPLFSPQSLIAEGSANFGIEIAFPGEARTAFEAEVLFPLAGLDPSGARAYRAVQERVQELSYADNEAARRYLDGEIDAEEAVEWLVRFAAMSRSRAAQRLRFIERYRSYVINYNLGEDLVERYVTSRGGTPDRPAERWRIFAGLLASPRLPSTLTEGSS